VFGPGRDDWDSGERLYPDDRNDVGRNGFGFSDGHNQAPFDPHFYNPAPHALAEAASALVRPYAVTGGRTKPRYHLQIEAMVAASHYEARDLSVLSPECQAILGFCRDWRSVAEISAVLRMPLGVARVLIADMAMEGLVRVHQIDHAHGGPDINLLERVLSGLRKL
jgi:Protein of unknown function (DUF742)